MSQNSPEMGCAEIDSDNEDEHDEPIERNFELNFERFTMHET